jgi:hypothetical protein
MVPVVSGPGPSEVGKASTPGVPRLRGMVDSTWPGRLRTAFCWVAVALEQVQRVVDDYKRSLEASTERGAHRRLMSVENARSWAIFMADVHFLTIAVTHLGRALDALGTMGANAPKVDNALRLKTVEIRHLLEHWEKEEQVMGSWKGLRERHGPGSHPHQLAIYADDLEFGPERLSLVELARELRRVERALIDLDTHGRGFGLTYWH